MMRPLTARELLHVWEQGISQPPVLQALALLTAASPDLTREQIASLSIGQRDGLLLTLREWTFGPRVESIAHCPHCGETLEINFELNDIRVSPVLDPTLDPTSDLQLEKDGYRVRYRLPNSTDLDIVGQCRDPVAAQQMLLSRCLLETVSPEDKPETTLSDPVAAAVIDAMAEQDPQADVQLSLTCPVCGHRWAAGFDIVTFFWHELNTWARRLLWDIHRLARAYGWSETEILALSSLRRQFYLEMVGL